MKPEYYQYAALAIGAVLVLWLLIFLLRKARGTFVLLVLALGLGSFIFYYEQHQKGTTELREDRTRVVIFEREKYKSISIKNPETKIELRKRDDDDHWYIEEPLKDRADSQLIATFFTDLEMLRSQSPIPLEAKDAKAQLKETGIADANTKVRFTGDDKPVELLFGKEPMEGKTLIYVEGAKNIYLIDADLKKRVSGKADDWRDRQLTSLTPARITKAEIKSPAGELELVNQNGHWSIAKPLQARGDDSKVNDLLAQALTARVARFVTDQNLAAYGLSEPRGTVTLHVEGAEKPVVLQYGANPKEEADKEKTFVRLSTRDAVMLVPKNAENVLAAKPNDLRDRHLLRFESDIVDRLTIETPGSEKLVLARKRESWIRKNGEKDEKINVALPAKLLAGLRGAQVVDFVSDVATDLPKYGLEQPSLKLTLSSYASENTAESGQGEKPIVSVLFGKKEKDVVYAKLDGEPFIVSAPAHIYDAIPTHALQLQELSIFQLEPEEITKLTVATPSKELEFEREKAGQWKLTKGLGVPNEKQLQLLATTLAKLHAARWAGPQTADQGFEAPSVTVTFTVTRAGQPTQELVMLGGKTPDDLIYARAQGREGTFVINHSTAEAFQGLFLQSELPVPPAAAPAPAATPAPGTPARATPAPTTPAPAPASAPAPAPEATRAPAAPKPATPAPNATPVPATPPPATPAPATPAPATPSPATPATPPPAAPAPAAAEPKA